ncbi:MAG: group II intron reverse transcriptase/maturase [Spirirestis rafaelensis WJT71-NPBG6]|jgi:RNA-directed DNA polymerase|nr:group II intron reverse transcriptase/maturase [Spirirestis rafaelensis WJT71-NPBG6]
MNPQRYEWNEIDWAKCRANVFKLQKRIFKASECGDISSVRKLQRLLVNSWSARCLAVRKVTQENQGRNTAGTDGVKSLKDEHKVVLIENLKYSYKASPTRRVWIPKPGKAEKRPLGIPTIEDRALQALTAMALEPEWEARFEENSYGFRPARSCQDAIDAIFNCISRQNKYVLDADVAQCFDKIDHKALLQKLNTFPKFRRQIKAWLQAGVVDGKRFSKTEMGVPQGGIISPLLANIALHGLENTVRDWVEENVKVYSPKNHPYAKKQVRQSVSVIRYADDFVILHKDLNVVLECKRITEEFLAKMGLELKEAKTRISHTLNECLGQKPGFDFLGFEIRQHVVGKDQGGKIGFPGSSLATRTKDYKTIIRPSASSVRNHYNKLKNGLKKMTNQSVDRVIAHLNPKIRGWSNYYRYVVSSKVFRKIDDWLYQRYWRWCKRKHDKKGSKYLKQKYFASGKNGNWVLVSKNKDELFYGISHRDTEISRHIKVKEDKSPYDGDWAYWSSRMGQYPEIPPKVATLLKKQKGKCPICGLYVRSEDIYEIDHVIPLVEGGRKGIENQQILHLSCHKKKNGEDMRRIIKNQTYNPQSTKRRQERYRQSFCQ